MKTVKYDTEKIQLTKAFIAALENLMKENILMMRVRDSAYRECWAIGACHITDLASASGITFQYGGINDTSILNDAICSVEIPL